MSMRRRASESSRPPEHNDPDLDISLVKADSLDSLSSGGDSDGGPEEPTAAEISLLSASIGEKKTKYRIRANVLLKFMQSCTLKVDKIW